MHATTQIGIPESMRIEHAEIHEELVRATRLSGPIGFQLCHGTGKLTDVSFRNVFYRLMKPAPAGK